MTKRDFQKIARREASGTFVRDVPVEFPDAYANRLELVEAPPTTSQAFQSGVYTIDNCSIVVVNEPMDFLQHGALVAVAIPPWANAIVGSTVLTESDELLARVEVDVLRPGDLDPYAAAFAATCASYDHALHLASPIDCLVRVGDLVLRIRASLSESSWSGTVDSASESERNEMARWRFYRSLNTAWGWEHGLSWCVFDGAVFRRVEHVRELAGKTRAWVSYLSTADRSRSSRRRPLRICACNL